jgi:DNA-binding response OmpR family regulator
MVADTHQSDKPRDIAHPRPANGDNHVVLMVLDHLEARPELKQVLHLSGYRVIDTDNGQDAARRARQTQPDILVVDMDVPLLYGLVAARQIIKHTQVGPMPVVIVTHDEAVDPAPMIEVGASRNEYVTRLSDYEELQHLLDYLLPVFAATAKARPASVSFATKVDTIRLPLFAASAPALHPHPNAATGTSHQKLAQPVHRISKYGLL